MSIENDVAAAASQGDSQSLMPYTEGDTATTATQKDVQSSTPSTECDAQIPPSSPTKHVTNLRTSFNVDFRSVIKNISPVRAICD